MERGFTIWMTGLPGSGRTTLAEAVAESLRAEGLTVEVIASSRLRKSPLGKGLGFTRADRDRNNRQLALAAQLLTANGVIAIVSAVSPYRSTREAIRAALGDFVEVYVSTAKEVCVDRDPRGLWAKALAGELKNFTGVDDPYEAPLNADVDVDMGALTAEQGTQTVRAWLKQADRLP